MVDLTVVLAVAVDVVVSVSTLPLLRFLVC